MKLKVVILSGTVAIGEHTYLAGIEADYREVGGDPYRIHCHLSLVLNKPSGLMIGLSGPNIGSETVKIRSRIFHEIEPLIRQQLGLGNYLIDRFGSLANFHNSCWEFYNEEKPADWPSCEWTKADQVILD